MIYRRVVSHRPFALRAPAIAVHEEYDGDRENDPSSEAADRGITKRQVGLFGANSRNLRTAPTTGPAAVLHGARARMK